MKKKRERREAGGAFLDGLNPEQRLAVVTTEGPLLVLAGAGSGKTRVITCRIAHLLSRGVDAKAILAVTFTNKAAREMRERVGALVGAGRARELTVSTFHSFCVRLLRPHAELLGLGRQFTICDEADQLAAVKGALRELRLPETRLHPRAALSAISRLKNRLVTPEQSLDGAADDYEELVARAYRAYNGHLKRSRAVDFDDLLLLAVELLSKHAAVRARLQERFRYLMVDEYQDTNGPQYEILRLLAGKRRNLCVVGDDDQAIYGFRGGDVRKILGFERDFKGATVIRLETNYRSTEPILEAANAVIRNNPSRHEKTLRASCGPGEPVRILPMEDEEHESQFVVDEIVRDVRAGRAAFGDVAILFRTAVQPRTFEARLRSARVPYELVGGMSFFDRKEVRDVLAYLRLAENPDDEASLLRVINVPPRGVGKATVERVVAQATKEGISAGAAFERADVPPDALHSFTAFRGVLADFARRARGAGLPQAVRDLLLAVNYKAELDRCYPDAFAREARGAAVGEVLNLAENYARRAAEATLGGFLEDVTLSEEETADEAAPEKEAVTLMTLHAAKGLEFPRVYLVGVEEGLLPHARAVAEGSVEEERRLLYVGITRARRHLTITRARTRAKYGRREACLPSRFLLEMKGEAATSGEARTAPPAGPPGGGSGGRRGTAPPRRPSSARRGAPPSSGNR